MTSPAVSARDGCELLRQLLLRGALSEALDLGDERAVHAFLVRMGASSADVAALTDTDLDEVRRRLQARRRLLDPIEAALDRLEESGLDNILLLLAIAAAAAALWRTLRGSAHAAVAAAASGPTPSMLGGLLVDLVPLVIAGLFACAALCGRPPAPTDEPYGDTTGFEDRDR